MPAHRRPVAAPPAVRREVTFAALPDGRSAVLASCWRARGEVTVKSLDLLDERLANDLFGLSAEEVMALGKTGYHPSDCYHSDPELKAVIDLIREGYFSRGDRELFRPLVDNLLNHDPYMLLADFRSYVDAQDQVGLVWRDVEHWSRMALLNIARSGKFSSDRSIQDYSEDIWKVKPVRIELLGRKEFSGGVGQ